MTINSLDSFSLFTKTIFSEQIEIREGRTKVLQCPPGKVVIIEYASYEGDAFFCKTNDVTLHVKGRCQWNRNCTLYAFDRIYGDSCTGPDESLYIRYICYGTNSHKLETYIASLTLLL